MCALHPLDSGTMPALRPSRRAAVLVLGMHRSGTSALTRALNLLGVELGENLLPAAADNEAGFWEHRDLVLVNDEALARLGSRWDDARPIPRERFHDPALEPLRDRAIAILRRDFSASAVWGLKDPRLCRLLPFWRPVLEAFDSAPHYVLALRGPGEVARSLRARNGFSPHKSHALWLAHELDAERGTRGGTRAFVTYDQLLGDWRSNLGRVARTLGLFRESAIARATAEIERFLDPSLRHHGGASNGAAIGGAAAPADSAAAAGASFPGEADAVAAWHALESAASGRGVDLAAALDAIGERHGARMSRYREPLTSVVVVTRNGLEHTRSCLESIARFTPEPHELIVVDNGSTDATRAYLDERAARDERLRVVANASNRGFAAANNQGLAIARGDVVVALNNDTIVTEGWLARMLAVLEEHPDAGIVGPLTNRASGPQVIPAPYGTSDELAAFARRRAREHAGESLEGRRLVAFCWAVRRSLIERIGGFDERFETGNCEDDDFCLRAAQAGYRARIALDAFVHHAGSATFRAEKSEYAALLRANFEKFKAKWGMDAAARPEDGYPFVELAAKADRPRVELAALPAHWSAKHDGRWREEPAAVSSPSGALRLQAGILPGAEPLSAVRAFFARCGHAGEVPRWGSATALDADLRRSEIALVLGGDVHFTEEALRTLASILRANPKIAAIGPVSNAAPAPQCVAAKYVDLDRDLRRFTERRARKFTSVWHDVPFLGAFALLLSGDAARAVGGIVASGGGPAPEAPIHEHLFHYYSRLRANGFRVACAPGVYVHHAKLTRDEGADFTNDSSSSPEPLLESPTSAVL